MKLFVGLGNPGKQYKDTRHNIGHQFIEILRNKELSNSKPACRLGRFDINTGFMNEAGLSVQKIVHFYKIDLNNFYLVHDDLDLPVGEYRIQFDRGPAGHHGVESVIGHLGSQAFNRIRIGIGKPPEFVDVADFVLQKFTASEKKIIDETIDKIVQELYNKS